jgi:hypothetical protein
LQRREPFGLLGGRQRTVDETRSQVQPLQNIDRRLWDKMLALDEAGLKTSMGKLLDSRQIGALLRRRDGMKKKIDALVAKNGDSIFF